MVDSKLVVVLLAFGLPSLWAPGPRANHKGNEAYRKGDYERAAREYARAREILPGERIVSYNGGTALLAAEKYEDALSALMAGAADPRPGVRNSSLYNSGNALFGSGKLPEAASAYREAILGDASDMDAKFNYELARREQKKQEEEQKKNEEKQKDQKQDQKKDGDQKQDQQQQQQQQQQDQQQQQQQQQQEQEQPQDQEQEQRPASLLSKEEAERLLDALKANEMEMIKARLKSGRRKNVDKDW